MNGAYMSVSTSGERIMTTPPLFVTMRVTARLRGACRAAGSRVRGTSRWLPGALCLLLAAAAPLRAQAADDPGSGRVATAVDVGALDPKLVSGVPESLGETVVQGPLTGEFVEYYAYDAVSSVRMVFDPAGVVVGQATYSPFGLEIAGSTGMPPERFAGQARDHEAQLDDFNARAYQARTGRFGAPDPVPGRLKNPQSWNRYSYAADNPLMFGDPTGLWFCPWFDGHFFCEPPPNNPWPEYPGPLTQCDMYPETCGGSGGGDGTQPPENPTGPEPPDEGNTGGTEECGKKGAVAADCAGGGDDDGNTTEEPEEEPEGFLEPKACGTYTQRVSWSFKATNDALLGSTLPTGLSGGLGAGQAMRPFFGLPAEVPAGVLSAQPIAEFALARALMASVATTMAVGAAYEVGVGVGSLISGAIYNCK